MNGFNISLAGKVAFVTGGNTGIGRSVCELLAKCGARVIFNYIENESSASGLVENIRSSGGSADKIYADVTKMSEIGTAVENILRTYGKVDILVNNAGIVRDRTIMKMQHEEWSKVIDVNLNGAFNCTRFIVPVMAENRSGKIIFISSVIGQKGGFGQTNYAASKAGLIGFAKSLALELASKNVQVNCVAPGFTDTQMLSSIPEDVREQLLKQIPMRRLASPEEVAYSVLFLASSMSDMITGQVIGVNGGLYM